MNIYKYSIVYRELWGAEFGIVKASSENEAKELVKNYIESLKEKNKSLLKIANIEVHDITESFNNDTVIKCGHYFE